MKYKYKVVGYQKEDKATGRLRDAVVLWVTANKSGEALDEAKKMIKKNNYRVNEIHMIDRNSTLEEYNLQNLLHQKYRKSIDAKMIKGSKELNKILKKIALILEM